MDPLTPVHGTATLFVTIAFLGKVHVPVDDSILTGGRESDTDNHPAFAHMMGILLLPVALIAVNTVLTALRANGTVLALGVWTIR